MNQCTCQPGSVQVCPKCLREDLEQQRKNVKAGRTPDDLYDLHAGNIDHFNKAFDEIFNPQQKRI